LETIHVIEVQFARLRSWQGAILVARQVTAFELLMIKLQEASGGGLLED
jgi:hypothetical protein